MILLIDYKHEETKELIERVGHDVPVKWRDTRSGVIFEVSEYDMIIALSNLNVLFQCSQAISMEDFAEQINYEYYVPEYLKTIFDEYVTQGWNFNCFLDREAPIVMIKVLDSSMEENNVYFDFVFDKPYCDEYIDCAGCDKCLKGKLEGQWYFEEDDEGY